MTLDDLNRFYMFVIVLGLFGVVYPRIAWGIIAIIAGLRLWVNQL